MIPASKLFYDFWRKFDASLTRGNYQIDVPEVAAYINEAQEIWITQTLPLAEVNQQIAADLRPLRMDEVRLKLRNLGTRGKQVAIYPKDMLHRLNQYVVATCQICPGITKEFSFNITQSDDIHPTKNDRYGKADFPFEQLPAQETNNGILLHIDGAFTVNEVVISYYRKPKEVHAPSLIKCNDCSRYYLYNGKEIRKDQGFEISSTYVNNVISDIAVLCALRDRGESQDYQTQLNKILTKIK